MVPEWFVPGCAIVARALHGGTTRHIPRTVPSGSLTEASAWAVLAQKGNLLSERIAPAPQLACFFHDTRELLFVPLGQAPLPGLLGRAAERRRPAARCAAGPSRAQFARGAARRAPPHPAVRATGHAFRAAVVRVCALVVGQVARCASVLRE